MKRNRPIKNRRRLQIRNYWAYHNRRKIPQPNGGYELLCDCGKAVELCPDCRQALQESNELENSK